jgi:protein TilB
VGLILVTVDLVRKRSEHNEGEISTLEEIALHQENIDKIEGLDKWCRDLKILLLQSNLIPKIGKTHSLCYSYLNLISKL